jgi:hypothetical protein
MLLFELNQFLSRIILLFNDEQKHDSILVIIGPPLGQTTPSCQSISTRREIPSQQLLRW